MKAALAALLLGVALPVSETPHVPSPVAPSQVAPSPYAASAATAIRAARVRYNAAISGRDVATLRTMFIDDYTGIAGTDGTVIKGGAAMVSYFANAFRNPSFIGFVRTPQVVEIAGDGGRAMERGHWIGRSTSDAGEKRLTGEYLAVWVPVGQGWQLRSESFVTLGHGEGPP